MSRELIASHDPILIIQNNTFSKHENYTQEFVKIIAKMYQYEFLKTIFRFGCIDLA